MTDAVKETVTPATFDDFMAEDGVEYATLTVPNHSKPVHIGSLTAGDLIEWSEANEGDAKRTAGLRLIIKSLVDKPATGAVRIALADKGALTKLRAMSHKKTEYIVKEILKLNGMNVKADAAEKND